MDLYYVLGIIGAGFVLLGFLLRRHARFGVGTKHYLLINLIGSICLTLYAFDGRVWPFFVINIVWAIDSAWGLIKK